ncbi:CRISPR associated protein Cas1 family [Nitrospirillum amazonense]|uniref:CRISPR associated protein Cas1 family n=1 Tax=Nitrospirillum amazonense TaxID=28077 RepID=A0A560EL45_9PROT|nr:CRISPR associated protein Cas1 family [Nitrospirillum amazonense]
MRARTLEAANGLRLAAATRRIPPPLENSRKCPRCSLLPLCLPDEVNLLRTGAVARTPPPAADAALPLYVQHPGARVGKEGEVLVIKRPAEDGGADGAMVPNEAPPTPSRAGRKAAPVAEVETRVPIGEVSELVLAGPVTLSTPALHALMRAEVPVVWMSSGFWYLGSTGGRGPSGAGARTAQYRLREDGPRRLAFARGLVEAKLRNQRTLLRRNWRGADADRDAVLERLRQPGRRPGHGRPAGGGG